MGFSSEITWGFVQKPWDFLQKPWALWYCWGCSGIFGLWSFDLELRCCFNPANCQTTEMKPDLAAMISQQDRNIWVCLWKLGIHLNSYLNGEYDYQRVDFRVPYFQTNPSIFSGDQHWSAGSNSKSPCSAQTPNLTWMRCLGMGHFSGPGNHTCLPISAIVRHPFPLMPPKQNHGSTYWIRGFGWCKACWGRPPSAQIGVLLQGFEPCRPLLWSLSMKQNLR